MWELVTRHNADPATSTGQEVEALHDLARKASIGPKTRPKIGGAGGLHRLPLERRNWRSPLQGLGCGWHNTMPGVLRPEYHLDRSARHHNCSVGTRAVQLTGAYQPLDRSFMRDGDSVLGVRGSYVIGTQSEIIRG